jgi:hypothetical protein
MGLHDLAGVAQGGTSGRFYVEQDAPAKKREALVTHGQKSNDFCQGVRHACVVGSGLYLEWFARAGA